MIRKIGRILSVLLLAALLFTAGACSFFSEETRREIENIYYRAATQDEKEGIMIIIDYVGDEYPDSVFFVPNGEEGKEGNGIASVDGELVDEGASIRITVSYTDKTRDPSVFTFANSVFPTDFTCELDEETGDYNISITLSNGDTSDFTLHNGTDGDTIESITTRYDEETGTTYIVITLATEEEEEPRFYEIAMPEGAKGDAGVGIDRIEVDEDRTSSDMGDKIWLTVYLTDGTDRQVSIPRFNAWKIVKDAPGAGDGYPGDFRFDSVHYKLYYKDPNEGWTVIMDLSDKSPATHQVQFMVDDRPYGDPIEMKHGEFFYKSGKSIPKPEPPEGFVFKGWYTELDEDGNPSVNSGQFTDLTPVVVNMKLYAYFAPVTATA